MTDIQDLYLRWLEYRCGLSKSDNPAETFHMLFWALQSVEFYSIIPRDDNRAEDGKELRQEFIGDYPELSGKDLSQIDKGPCTFLEMMVGLAKRIDFEQSRQNETNKTGYWFFEMIRNLGLDSYNDAFFIQSNGKMAVKNAARKVIDRTFEPDGSGGLFPLKHPRVDQRSVEIWYQMNSYLMECYSF